MKSAQYCKAQEWTREGVAGLVWIQTYLVEDMGQILDPANSSVQAVKPRRGIGDLWIRFRLKSFKLEIEEIQKVIKENISVSSFPNYG